MHEKLEKETLNITITLLISYEFRSIPTKRTATKNFFWKNRKEKKGRILKNRKKKGLKNRKEETEILTKKNRRKKQKN